VPDRSQAKKPKGRQKRKYKMRVSGGLVKQLGLQMYAGAVPAIAELVSNAWDAMSRSVWIEIPLDRTLSPQDQIVVTDDGHGMTYSESNASYLLIGRDRRAAEGDFSRPYGDLPPRKLQSRKGIGKLAGFGIANRVEVRTVARREISHFAMDYDDIVRSGKFVDKGGYNPEPLKEDGKLTKERPGTKITLSELKITRAIGTEQFRTSMARRFTVLSDEFRVFINGILLRREEFPFEFRFPETSGTREAADIPGAGQIHWWVGFSRKPIPDEDARGIVVYARGKMAQTPWFFGLSGGAWGQHGMQYMTGEVEADFLDQTDGQDLIATDRGTVRWEDPLASPLKEWGLKKVRALLDQWTEKREEKRVKSPTVVKYLALADTLPDRERRVFRSFVSRVCAIPQIDQDREDRDIVDDLVEFGFNALTNRHFFEVLRQLSAASPDHQQALKEILSEWNVVEAILTAQQVKGRVEIIRKFREMVEHNVLERDMQDYVVEHKWLIDPTWEMLKREESCDNWLAEKFGIPKGKSEPGRKIPDFYCLGDSRVVHIVDLKRPGESTREEHLDQIRKYVEYIRQRLKTASTDPRHTRAAEGLLVVGTIRPEDSEYVETLRKTAIYVREWTHLLSVAEELHREFLVVVKSRAAEDPRIKALDASTETEITTLGGK